MRDYPSKENLKVNSGVSGGVIEVIGEYFPKSTVSIGSIARKLPFLLMSLVKTTGLKWTARFEYVKSHSRFETVLSSEKGDRVVVYNDATKGADIANSFKVMNSMFRSDKWVKCEVTYSNVVLNTADHTFTYEKSKYTGDEKPVYVFTMSGTRKILGSISSWLRGTDTDEINSYEVVKTSNTPLTY